MTPQSELPSVATTFLVCPARHTVSVTFSPITISAIRGLPRYIEAFPSRMITTSQNAGMYAPPAALGPNSRQICGTWPERRTSV